MQYTLTTSPPLSITGREIGKTNTYFWKLCASICIVTFFVTVKLHNNIDITIFLLFGDVNSIVAYGWGLFFLLSSSILFMFLGFFLLIYSALLQGFRYFDMSWF